MMFRSWVSVLTHVPSLKSSVDSFARHSTEEGFGISFKMLSTPTALFVKNVMQLFTTQRCADNGCHFGHSKSVLRPLHNVFPSVVPRIRLRSLQCIYHLSLQFTLGLKMLFRRLDPSSISRFLKIDGLHSLRDQSNDVLRCRLLHGICFSRQVCCSPTYRGRVRELVMTRNDNDG